MTAEHGEHQYPSAARLRCTDCGLFRLCLPFDLGEGARERFNSVVLRRRVVKPNECVFRARQPLRSLYAIRSGSIKTSVPTRDGGEQITGFRLPGEILGFDAIAAGRHPGSAVALEGTRVCELSFKSLQTLARRLPKLHDNMLGIMSSELRHAQDLAVLRRTRGAGANLAAFLLGLSEHYHRLGLSADQYRLSMPRCDIADYLGVAIETVSRLIARFEEDGLLVVRRRHVRLCDVPGLRAAAGLPDAG
jgi:CRP/FNR family transcriptional regulator